MEPIVVSIKDAASALSLGRTTIYALIRAKRLEVRKIGRRTLVQVASLQRLLAEP